jgi:hypothetical protein
MIDTHPMHEKVITTVNTHFSWSKKRYRTRSIQLDIIKKLTAWDSFRSVYSCSSYVMSLKIRRGGVLIATMIIAIAIPNRTRKLASNYVSLSLSHTTM